MCAVRQRRDRRDWIVPALILLALILSPTRRILSAGNASDDMTNPGALGQDADISIRWAERVNALKEVPLPDDWYQMTAGDSGRRIDEMVRRIERRDDLSPAEKSELLKRLDNDGQPFVHRIFYNRPMPPRPGAPRRGEGLITVVSMKNRASTAILLSEMLDVTEKRATFSPARIRDLESIFK